MLASPTEGKMVQILHCRPKPDYALIFLQKAMRYFKTTVYSGHLGASLKCPDNWSVQVILDVNESFGTITKCPDHGGVLIFKGPD